MANTSGTVLVTGGAGFIGSYIVEELLRRGYDVRVFDSLEPQVHGALHDAGRPPAYLTKDVEFITGDVRDRDAVVKALVGVDYLFHQAALVGVPQSMYDIRRYTDINSLGGATVLDAVVNTRSVRDRLKKMVVASSKSIYGEGAYRCAQHGLVYPRFRPLEQLQRHDWPVRCPVEGCGRSLESVPTDEDKPLMPVNVYAIGKRDHEEMFLSIGHAYGIPAVALRYWQVYGARQALSNPYTGVAAIFSSRILAGNQPPIYEDGQQLVDFVHVTDIARANALALERSEADYQAINIGTGTPLSVLDVAWTLIREMGADQQGADQQGMAPNVLGEFRPGDTRDCYPDISKARRLLGFQPQVSFQQGAAELVAWVRDQQGKVEDRFEQAQRELREHGLAGT
ncbi:MAG: SDR family NAD(P)-dependent oxidoreductase [Chloroflexota bacterium]